MLRTLVLSFVVALAGCSSPTLPPDAAVPSDVGRDAPARDAPRDAPPRPRAPQLLWPSGGVQTVAASPTFRWIPSAGAARSRIEVCIDPGCRSVETSLDTSEDRARLAIDLRGTLFWRVLALDESGATIAGSPPRAFAIGTREEETDAALDLVGGVPSAGRVVWFEGVLGAARDVRSAGGVGSAALFVVSRGIAPDGFVPFYDTEARSVAVAGPRRGRRVARAGDLDGDGLPDVVVDREDTLAVVTWQRTMPVFSRPLPIESGGLGDFDGDGDGDLALTFDDRLEVRAFDVTSVAPFPTLLLSTPIGAPIFERGDFDGDGLGDALTTRPGAGLQICFGQSAAPRACEPIGDAERPDDFWMVRDVIGDASTDFVVRVGDRLELWSGSTSRRFDTRVEIPWAGPGRTAIHSLAGVGDVDTDGFSELAISVETDDPAAPYVVLVYRGGAAGLTPMPDIVPPRSLPHHLVVPGPRRLGIVFDATEGVLTHAEYAWDAGVWTEIVSDFDACSACSFSVEVAR